MNVLALNRVRDSEIMKGRVEVLQSMGVDFDAPYFDDNLYKEYLRTDGVPFAYPITLYYEKLVIQSYYGWELEVHDTYVRIYFDLSGNMLRLGRAPIRVSRTSATRAEFLKSYVHSHPGRGGNFSAFQDVCAGDGPLISILIQKGNRLVGNEFRAFVIAIKAFLEWENAGYDYISKVLNLQQKIKETGRVDMVFGRSAWESDILRELCVLKAIKMNISDDVVRVEFVNDLLVKAVYRNSSDKVLVVKPDGMYKSPGEDVRPTTSHVLVYKGEKKYLRVIDEEDQIRMVNPEFEEVLRALVKKKVIKKINEQREAKRDKANTYF